jgi:hypothetical protein
MVKVLMIMQHIALCTPCIVLLNHDHLLHMQVDHAEPKTEILVDQVQWVFGGQQESSYEDANIVVFKATPVHLTTILSFVYNFILIMILTCALSCRS